MSKSFPNSFGTLVLAEGTDKLPPDRLLLTLESRLLGDGADIQTRNSTTLSFTGSVWSELAASTSFSQTKACRWASYGTISIEEAQGGLQVSYHASFVGAFWASIIVYSVLAAILFAMVQFVLWPRGMAPRLEFQNMLLTFLPLLPAALAAQLVIAAWRFHRFVKRCIKEAGGNVVRSKCYLLSRPREKWW